jgi:hypothetical protein
MGISANGNTHTHKKTFFIFDIVKNVLEKGRNLD